MSDRTHYRLCSSCKKELHFGAPYYVCSVSTCNRKRTGLTFCSVPCFEAHVPMVRHREAWAEEKMAPARDQWEAEQSAEREWHQHGQARARARPQQAGAGREHGPRAPAEKPAQGATALLALAALAARPAQDQQRLVGEVRAQRRDRECEGGRAGLAGDKGREQREADLTVGAVLLGPHRTLRPTHEPGRGQGASAVTRKY